MPQYTLHVLAHCLRTREGRASTQLKRVKGPVSCQSIDEALAWAETLVATARAKESWNSVLDSLADLSAGKTWTYDLIRGIDRIEVRSDAGQLCRLGLIVFGPTLVWTPTAGIPCVQMLITAERAKGRAALANERGQGAKAERYTRIARKLEMRAIMFSLAGVPTHIERDRAF